MKQTPYITRDQLIELIKEEYQDEHTAFVAFRLKGYTYYSTRQVEQSWKHSWRSKINRDTLTPHEETK